MVKNRLHLDIHASGERTDPIEIRRRRVDAEAARLAGLGATITGPFSEDHLGYGVSNGRPRRARKPLNAVTLGSRWG